jgi:hypothetical protein
MVGRALFLVILLAMFGVQLSAQTVTGTINGSVLDSSGSSVPNAQLTVLNQDTGVTRNVVSTNEGEYTVPQLPAGRYEVDAAKAGFSTAQLKDIVVTVGSNVRVDVRLQVGEMTEKVTVSEAIPNIETTSADVSQLMDEAIIKDIPLNARDTLQLAEIQPGVQFNNFSHFGKQLIVSGSREEENRFLQEGIDTTFTFRRTPVSTANIILGVEAVREFKVLVGNYSAEYGEHVGGIVNTIFKSGTNSFHGSAYEFFRDDVFDARNFFDPESGAPPFKRHQFGVSLGGPIKKDKTFFFFNYEGFRHTLGLSNVTNIPNPQTRAGNLPCNQYPTPKPPACGGGVNQNTTLVNVNNAPGFATASTPFVLGLMNLVMNLPCTGPDLFTGAVPGVSVGNDTGVCTNTNNPIQTVTENFYLLKIDHTFNAKHSISASYNFDQSFSDNPNQNPSFSDEYFFRKQIGSFQETWIISPNIVNTARFGVNRTKYFKWIAPLVTIPDTIVGFSPFTRTQAAYTPAVGVKQFPNIGVTNLTGLATNGEAPRWLGYTMAVLTDDVNYLRGKHAFQFGGEAKKTYDNVYLDDTTFRTSYSFSGVPAFLQGNATSLSDSVESLANGGRSYSSVLYGLYAEDTYKVKPNLTLTLGLRWEYLPRITEKYGKVALFGMPDTWSDPLKFPTQGSPGQPMFAANPHLFSPRFGFNWDPFKDGKTSVRGGGSIFHDQIGTFTIYFGTAEQYPFTTTLNLSSVKYPFALNPPVDLSTLFASATDNNAIPKVTMATLMPTDIPKVPTKYGYNLEVQRELPAHLALMVGYVGSQSRHAARTLAANTFFPIVQAPGSNVGCTDSTGANISYGGVCGCPPGGPSCLFWNTQNSGLISTTTSAGTRFLPNRNFTGVSGAVFDANAFYNALQVTLERRAPNGLTLRLNYTHQSCVADLSDFIGTSLDNGGASLQYTRDPKSSRGRCTNSGSDAANFSFSYPVPFGQSFHGPAKLLASGWQISSLTSIAAGVPEDISLGFNNSHSTSTTGAGSDRPNLVAGCNSATAVIDPRSTPTPFYFNANCFSKPVPGYLGNLGGSFVTGPGLWTTDVSLKKYFAFKREGMGLEMRAEMFNAFNRTNFRAPTSRSVYSSSGAPSATFGQINQIVGTSRQFQVGARFQF